MYLLAGESRSATSRPERGRENAASQKERAKFLSVTSEQKHAGEALFPPSGRGALQCGQRAAEHNGRENRGAKGGGSRDGEERVGEQIGPEMRGGVQVKLVPTQGSIPQALSCLPRLAPLAWPSFCLMSGSVAPRPTPWRRARLRTEPALN